MRNKDLTQGHDSEAPRVRRERRQGGVGSGYPLPSRLGGLNLVHSLAVRKALLAMMPGVPF